MQLGSVSNLARRRRDVERERERQRETERDREREKKRETHRDGEREREGSPRSPHLSADAAERCLEYTAVERMWQMQDSQGQILALAFRQKSSKPCKVFPLRSEAATRPRLLTNV